jgi:hypothetical protein
VAVDLDARTVTVMPAETGYAATLWQQGYREMVQGGYGGPTVWASGARGHPEGGALKFTFPRGNPAWAELVAQPRLSAIITVDRRRGTILGVKFRSRAG